MKWLPVIARLIVGGVFVVAGALKILDPGAFAVDVANFRMLPHPAVNLIAITLPWVELVAGVLMVIGVWSRGSALVITAMCVLFLIALTQALARGLDVRCGCFGTVEARKVGLTAIAQDVVLLAGAVWLLIRSDKTENGNET